MDNDKTTWAIEQSHIIAHPETIDTHSLPELRVLVQRYADNKKSRPDCPPMGEIHFRYEMDEDDKVNLVHTYFTNQRGKLQRFMRLRRIES